MTEPASNFPEWLDGIWAKSSKIEAQPGESLARHTWEVICRLKDVAQARPWLPNLCGFPQLWIVLFWGSFFHDWGKAACGFQEMLRGKGRWAHRHEVLSLSFLSWISQGFTEETSTAIAAAIVSHHRDADELARLYPLILAPEDDPITDLIPEVEETVLRGLHRWLRELTPLWIESLGFKQFGVVPIEPVAEKNAIESFRKNGAAEIRGWLRKYQRLVRALDDERRGWILAGLLCRGFTIQADHTASAHASSLPILSCRKEAILAAVGLNQAELHEHQREAARADDSAMLISPTGSGKTEASLLWASRQAQGPHGLPRLFYVLPYQASMNAMYDRLNSIFPGQVGLLHSRSILALYRRFMDREYGPEQAAREARWARNLAELHYHPVQVFSPYQMLKAAYQLKGYEAMLADYAGTSFIFDEIHAYEPERLAMILEFVRYLGNQLCARFFVMSATMPQVISLRVKEVLGNPCDVRASDELFEAFTRHLIHLLRGDLLSESGIEQIQERFNQGKSVLVTCNTVQRAQTVYHGLQSKLPPDQVVLIHGRFNGRDRLKKERDILAATGLKSRERHRMVVVSTQVVEVSLNIDLDVLFSDPAPLEALLQRLGRVNRNRRADLAPAYIFSDPADGQGVYLPKLVQAALDVLQKYANGVPLREGLVGLWLDEIYNGDVLNEWDQKYTNAAKDFREAFLLNLRPFSSDDTLTQAFDRMFDGTEVLPLSLQEEYRTLREERPIEASQLLVSISWRRWTQLQRANCVRSEPNQWPPVVDVQYSSELGLIF